MDGKEILFKNGESDCCHDRPIVDKLGRKGI